MYDGKRSPQVLAPSETLKSTFTNSHFSHYWLQNLILHSSVKNGQSAFLSGKFFSKSFEFLTVVKYTFKNDF